MGTHCVFHRIRPLPYQLVITTSGDQISALVYIYIVYVDIVNLALTILEVDALFET